MNNEPPALMLASSCCYGKQGIILEWPKWYIHSLEKGVLLLTFRCNWKNTLTLMMLIQLIWLIIPASTLRTLHFHLHVLLSKMSNILCKKRAWQDSISCSKCTEWVYVTWSLTHFLSKSELLQRVPSKTRLWIVGVLYAGLFVTSVV